MDPNYFVKLDADPH